MHTSLRAFAPALPSSSHLAPSLTSVQSDSDITFAARPSLTVLFETEALETPSHSLLPLSLEHSLLLSGNVFCFLSNLCLPTGMLASQEQGFVGKFPK